MNEEIDADTGLPKHVMIGMTKEGRGPAFPQDIGFDRWACWCGDNECQEWRAMATEEDLIEAFISRTRLRGVNLAMESAKQYPGAIFMARAQDGNVYTFTAV